jgi:hypothetical protein
MLEAGHSAPHQSSRNRARVDLDRGDAVHHAQGHQREQCHVADARGTVADARGTAARGRLVVGVQELGATDVAFGLRVPSLISLSLDRVLAVGGKGLPDVVALARSMLLPLRTLGAWWSRGWPSISNEVKSNTVTVIDAGANAILFSGSVEHRGVALLVCLCLASSSPKLAGRNQPGRVFFLPDPTPLNLGGDARIRSLHVDRSPCSKCLAVASTRSVSSSPRHPIHNSSLSGPCDSLKR